MFLLDHVTREEAGRTPESAVARAYSAIPPHVPLPAPLEMMSASPELAAIHSRIIRYYATHEKLDFGFFALLRMVAAHIFDYSYCVQLNSTILQRAGGMEQAELEVICADPSKAPLDEPQRSLFIFAVKLIRDPASIDKEDVDAIRDLGFSDSEIYDVAYHAAMMQGPAMLYKAFVK